ncbi:MAG: DNA translocase FtsK [Anaerolineales bacterium]
MNPTRVPRKKAKKELRPQPFMQLQEPRNDWLDRLAALQAHFGRFARDVFGVVLLAIAAMTFFALLGFSEGIVLVAWVSWLKTWAGWGSYPFALSLGWMGVVLLQRDENIPIGRVLTLELTLLLTLGLLAVIGGHSPERAELGLDGGQIGWGLAYLFVRLAGKLGAGIILFVLWLLAAMGAFGVWTHIELWLSRLAGEEPVPEPIVVSTSEPAAGAATEAAESKPNKKRQPALPPEFRKSLRASEQRDSKPLQPPPRSEELPPLKLLSNERAIRPDERTINQTAGMIEKTLSDFGIPATVIGFRVGPTVTQFAVQPGFIKKPGTNEADEQQMKVRVRQIAALKKDLALALAAQRLRIEAPVPGKPYVGIEVPNTRSAVVRLRSMLESEEFYKVGAPLAIALGRDVSGTPVVADLARMPHLLIAGATGSGKSVCITSIAACLTMNNAPEDLRLVMIDSKMVELLRYNGLPHLYGKVETDLERILGVLRWVVVEMEHRYRLLEGAKARDLDAYNRKLRKRNEKTLPRIVVIIDELADLMMSAPDQTEHNLVRLAQMARATGIHLVVATQRPSTDVVTGLIKANFPARLAFAVASGVDSRVILDTTGAETLLGNGDMLFLNPEIGNPIRAQGVMATDQEIERIITHWQKVSPVETEDVPPWEKLLQEPAESEEDALVDEAIAIVRSSRRASASLLQRRLRIGYPRAARLLDQLEEMGIVGPSQGGGRERDVLIEEDDEFDEM